MSMILLNMGVSGIVPTEIILLKVDNAFFIGAPPFINELVHTHQYMSCLDVIYEAIFNDLVSSCEGLNKEPHDFVTAWHSCKPT